MGHLSEFFDTRAEIRPKGAVKRIYGWVSSGSEGVLVLDVDKSTGLTYGQAVEVVLSARHISTRFIAVFVGEENGEAIFSVPVSYPRLPGSPSARLRGKYDRVTCVHQGTRLLLPVLDASESGIAVLSPHPIEPGAEVQMELDAHISFIPFQAVALYCQAVNSEDGDVNYRVGFEIMNMMRTDVVRWRRSLSQRAA